MGERMEKQECLEAYEQKNLIMSDEKCEKCENIYQCKFYAMEMNDIVNGSD